jgi:hypothetical protein
MIATTKGVLRAGSTQSSTSGKDRKKAKGAEITVSICSL